MAPEDGGERSLAGRHDEVRRDLPALRARVRQVLDHDVPARLDALRNDVEGRLRVVGEVRLGGGRRGRGGGDEEQGDEGMRHGRLSVMSRAERFHVT